jgi:maleate isomerase
MARRIWQSPNFGARCRRSGQAGDLALAEGVDRRIQLNHGGIVGERADPACRHPALALKPETTMPRRLGMLTPSSNTVLEPMTVAMLGGVADTTAHFARFKVTEIALSEAALGQFDDTEILRAAELLAHAKVDVIAWSGTSSSWLGFDRDEKLCGRITAATGIPASTAVLALNEILGRTGTRRLGLVTPYRDDVQEKIVANYAGSGIAVVAEQHLRIQDNYSFAEVDTATIEQMIRGVAAARPEAIAVLCTNMRGAPLVASLESELGIPVYDSVAVTVWKALLVCDLDPSPLRKFGRMFADPRLGRA